MSPDRAGAGRVLAAITRLLPPHRRAWGAAMRAELAAVERGRARWGFVLGCARVVVSQPVLWRAVGYPLLMLGAVVAAVVWTARVGYAPMRWGLVGLVALLVVVAWFGRRRGPLGPVGGGRAARWVRASGYVLVWGYGGYAVVFLATHGNQRERAEGGLPLFAVLLTTYLLGLLAVTARASAATARGLAVGVVSGLGAAGVWTATVFLAPPIPPDAGLAVALLAAAMIVAGYLAGLRGRTDGLLAALVAGVSAGLLLSAVVGTLADYGPQRLIPGIVTQALTPADNLANSRIELGDPYVWLMPVGFLVAAALAVTSFATRRRPSSTVE